MSFMFDKVKGAVADVQQSMKGKQHHHAHQGNADVCTDGDSHHLHRFQSFAPEREGNDVKWYVDACGYMWAVSMALESAQHEIWILDWWLSPELYLRRPPAKNEQYRLDKMLFAAAKRGVKVNVIVYKEVTQALTLSSHHTKHWLMDNDKTGNIKVMRHPDHLPDAQAFASNAWSNFTKAGLNAAKLSSLPSDALQGIYGMNEDTILYWAHHEKLCAVDGHIAFMGGLDLCYGRWDTNQHSIADAHPGDLDQVVFPGQDYNNARIMDFQDVANWQNNKLDRRFNSRMGWSDMSISLRGPVVEDLRAHFAQRWNFIYFDKYDTPEEKDGYKPINFSESRFGIIGHPYQDEPDGHGQYEHFRNRMQEQFEKGRDKLEQSRKRVGEGRGVMEEGREMFEEGHKKFDEGRDRVRKGKHRGDALHTGAEAGHPSESLQGGMHCQIMRSCTKWSHGVPLEHSIANAYIDTIKNSKHFVYIENQFFITATDDTQKPVYNRIGQAIADRCIQAGQNNENWHMIVAMPSVPAFAGDLKADDALGTRAIMEFQYNSINRSGHSIMEKVAKAGFDPMEYIRFYNLRNYDRLNTGKTMGDVEKKAGVKYEDARQGYDQRYGQAGEGGKHMGKGHEHPKHNDDAYEKYQRAAKEGHGSEGHKVLDSVASCYMLGGEDIRNVSWDGDAQSELDAFVSEELYIHSKLMIADDRKVICGSANLNDRSQLGSHDSEIAICIEDQEEIDSYMGGQPWRASKFAASLRRQIFRKHLGLIPPQDIQKPDANYTPIGHDHNLYDWGSREDHAVADPLAPSFHKLWKQTARTNTEAFRRIFHPVPDDSAKNWKQYDEYYEKYFKPQDAEKEKKEGKDEKPATWKIGHVVQEEFSKGEKGLHEVKEILSRVRGTLVEMPLLFLKQEDIAKEGLSLNSLTEQVYT